MSTTRGKPSQQVQKNGPVSTSRVSDTSDTDAVLTLSEAATCLRVAESHTRNTVLCRIAPTGRSWSAWWLCP
jgi:hypothetical protein